MQGVMKVGENVTNFIFQKLGMNGQQVAVVVDKQIDSLPKVSGGEPYLSREANDVLQKATQYSKGNGRRVCFIGTYTVGVAHCKKHCIHHL